MSDYKNHSRLICHAPHPDPKRSGEKCGYTLVDSFPGLVAFVRTSQTYPEPPDPEIIAARCSRKACNAVNLFRLEKTAAELIGTPEASRISNRRQF